MHPPVEARHGEAMAWMAAAALLWTVVEGLGAALPRGTPPLQVVWVRYATHVACLGLLVGPSGLGRLIRTRQPGWQLVRGLLMVIMPVCFVAGVAGTGLRTAWAIIWIAPVLAAAMAAFWLRETPSTSGWIAIALGAVGAVLSFGARRPAALSGAAWLVGAAAALAGYMVLARARPESLETDLFFTGAVVLAALSPAMPAIWQPLGWRALLPMAGIGVAGLGLLAALERALRLAPVSVAAPIGYTQALWAAGFHYGMTGITPGVTQTAGALMVAAVTGWLVLGRRTAGGAVSARIAGTHGIG